MQVHQIARLLAVMLACSVEVFAQEYPTRPVTIVIPFAPGGGTDLVARPVAEKLREKWGQPFLIDNRAGAGGNIGAEHVFRAPGDGYTLLFVTPGQLAINKYLYASIAYEPEQFVPVSVLTNSPNVLVVNAKRDITSVKQLIAYARANPDKMSYGSSGVGTTTHLSAELFKSMTGTRIVHVPYKGAAAYLADMTSGTLDMSFFLLGTALPQIRAGKLRALGVGGEKRNAALPDVPPISDEVPGFVSSVWYGIVSAPKTPSAISNRLSAAMAEAVKQPSVAALFANSGLDAVGSTPAEMALLVRQENERWSKVVRATGAKAE